MSSAAPFQPKYSIAEVERRWLVEPAALGALEGQQYREIEDLYITGTQMRLRKIECASGPAVFKLCKKYGKSSALSEAITNLYLSEAEYRLLAHQGRRLGYKAQLHLREQYLESVKFNVGLYSPTYSLSV